MSLLAGLARIPGRLRRTTGALPAQLVLSLALLLTGCEGRQSALDSAGTAAADIANLFWWMAGGAAVIWTAVVGLGVYAIYVHPEPHPRRFALMIIGGGAVFPTVVLAALLSYGLALLPRLVAPAPEGSLRIHVVGEQWWWRVRYEMPDGSSFDLANEIRIPVDEPVQFALETADVIHSFWIPSLGGKIDMMPGRRTQLALTPSRTGIFRGACAEYCGESHAWMAFDVVVQEQDEFEQWLEGQRQSAQEPVGELAQRGEQLFLESGCAACHAIRGTPAVGVVGPDLTHVGSRLSLAAATFPNEPEVLRDWIAKTKLMKPGVHMPAFDMLPDDDLQALAAYLDGLE